MRRHFWFSFLFGIAFLAIQAGPAGAAGNPQAKASTEVPRRIVSVNPGLTEIVLELGEGSRLVGIDIASNDKRLPPNLPRVGYQRALSAEGLLALKPDLVLATEDAGPPVALDALRSAGVRVLVLSPVPSVDALHGRIRSVAEVLGQNERGASLTKRIDKDLASARLPIPAGTALPVLLYVRSHGGSALQVAGTKTAADALIRLLGATNAASQFEGYRAMGAEAVLAAAPAALLVARSTADAMGGGDAVVRAAGLANTPAARAGRVLIVDDAPVLGFGPSIAQAALQLRRELTAVPASASAGTQ